eukprot:1150131-Pelagomonas_calceolata.AAC.1
MMQKITLLFQSGFLKLRGWSLDLALSSCNFQSGKGVGIRAELKFNKVKISILNRDVRRVKRRGARIIRETFPGPSMPCTMTLSLEQASFPIRDVPHLPSLGAFPHRLSPPL